MNISCFTFIVTDDCNYRCSYCPQKREQKFISPEVAKKTADFIYPLLADRATIGFYGGEPLLCFDEIRETVSYFNRKNASQKEIGFLITTNGSLIDKKILEFLNQNRFSVILSFDGYAHNISRKRGDFELMVTNIEKMKQYPHIGLEINSVFTPGTVGCLSESIRLFLDIGVEEIRFTVSTIEEWGEHALEEFENELLKAASLLISNYRKNGSVPVSNFRASHRTGNVLFGCNAGKDRMSVTPDGKLWGCYSFHDYFKGKETADEYSKYCFGNLVDLTGHRESLPPGILSNYAALRMDNFECEDSYCFLCGDIFSCRVCPVNAAYSTSVLGKVPGWVCKINKVRTKMRAHFQERIREA